jgi:hypothetical protein
MEAAMKKTLCSLATCALLTACATTSMQDATAAPQDAAPVPQKAERSANTMRLYIGGRGLDQSEWTPVEDQVSSAFEFVREPADSLLGFEIGTQFGISGERIQVAGSGDADVVSTISELYGGVHRTFFRDSSTQPYIGGGVTLLYARFATDFGNVTTSDEDTSAGLYLHGGVQTHLGTNFIIGLDLRTVFGTDITLFGSSGDADYGQLAFFIGVGF